MNNDSPITGRNMFIWRLMPILKVEMGIYNFVRKAKRAKLSSVWIKIAFGATPYKRNINDDLIRVRDKLKDEGISIWGYHETRCKTEEAAKKEAEVVAKLADDLKLQGILMDAEKPEGTSFFQGGEKEAKLYAERLRQLCDELGLGLAITSHDIPQNFPGFPFESFAAHAHINASQVYYGSSPNVQDRLERAINANSMLTIPFVPVGSGWVGSGGGCSTASVCAERAKAFMQLVREHQFPGYSFWDWAGAPMALWEVLFDTPV